MTSLFAHAYNNLVFKRPLLTRLSMFSPKYAVFKNLINKYHNKIIEIIQHQKEYTLRQTKQYTDVQINAFLINYSRAIVWFGRLKELLLRFIFSWLYVSKDNHVSVLFNELDMLCLGI